MKALFVGLGGVGQRHLRILKSTRPDCKLIAVRRGDRNFEITDTLAADHSVDINKKYDITTFSNLQEAIQSSPDFAIVANPTSLHVETIKDLVKNKTPTLVEKPLAHSLHSFNEVMKLAEEYKSFVQPAFMMRYHPQAMKIKEVLGGSVLGKINSVSININSYCPDWHKYEQVKDFYVGNRELGGGVVLTESHELDLLTWFFGKSFSTSVIPATNNPLELDVEDTVGAITGFKHNGGNFPALLQLSFSNKTPLRRMLLIGEKGWIEWDIKNMVLNISTESKIENQVEHLENFDRNSLFEDQMRDFLKKVEEKNYYGIELKEYYYGQDLIENIVNSLRVYG